MFFRGLVLGWGVLALLAAAPPRPKNRKLPPDQFDKLYKMIRPPGRPRQAPQPREYLRPSQNATIKQHSRSQIPLDYQRSTIHEEGLKPLRHRLGLTK
jgi:hypothetical protein